MLEYPLKDAKIQNLLIDFFLHFSFKNAPDFIAAKRQLKKVQISNVIITKGCTSNNASFSGIGVECWPTEAVVPSSNPGIL